VEVKNLKLFVIASLTGVVLASGFTATTYAWHPEVKITKYVTNVTTTGEKSDANTTGTAVSTKPGDIIKYTMVIENTASPAGNGHNDLHFTKMTDNLPAGVELVDDTSKRSIVENLGILKPGDKITKEYTLKVTSATDGAVITNEACVAGDSEVKDAPRSDCDKAVIKVKVPVTPPASTPPTPKPPKKEEPKALPQTGPAGIAMSTGAVTVLGYLGNLLRLKRRDSKN
jgi:uncharacterized repeat protein (TIGR01451 family)